VTYDEGLNLPAGPVTATNTTGKRERVLRPEEGTGTSYRRHVEEPPPWRR
jgi:hypothetical protein